jgi:transketolase
MDIRGMARTVRGKQGREVVQDVLVDVGRAHPDVVIVGADSFRSIRGLGFQAEFPERSFNVGIAEQNAVGIAAGLAISGKLPVVLMFGFTVARALEQIRSSLCYPNLDARIITTATGLDMGEGGATHHCTEDVGLLRTIANMTIIQAASALETVLATRALIEQVHGTAYLRLTRQSYTDEAEDALEEYYAGGRGFEVGRAIVLREGTDMLRERGVHAQVLNVHTIKPLDVATLSEISQTVGGIVTMEDHNVLGGLGEAVAGVVTRFGSTKVLRIGIDDAFCEIGKPADLCQHHGLCADRVVDRTLDLLAE